MRALSTRRHLALAGSVAAAVALLLPVGSALRLELLIVPVVLSLVLLAAAPHSPFSSSRAILLAYGLAAVTGTGAAAVPVDIGPIPAAAAVGAVLLLGLQLEAVHPPACALALLLATSPMHPPVVPAVFVAALALGLVGRLSRAAQPPAESAAPTGGCTHAPAHR